MLKKVIATVVLLCSCLMLVPSFESRAQTPLYFEIPIAEPTTSANSGYIVVIWENKTNGQQLPYVFYWSVTPTNSDSSTSTMSVTVNKNGSLYFYVNQGNAGKCIASLFMITESGYCTLRESGTFTAGANMYSVDYSASYKIVGYYVRGNYGDMYDDYGIQENRNFVISWADDDIQLNYMINLYNKLAENNVDNDTIISKLDSIMASNSSIDSKISQLLDLQEETNTWLEKIFNYLNESQEQQKQEAQTQGNSSVSQGSSAIEDKGGDFAGSLSGLTNSMSYTGTDCSWTFPTVKLPAIPGVMDEVTLIESQPIDFTFWVNAIPSGIMLIIQSVLTIGLIVYCFKELYSTIAYVLTLRKDDNS